MLQIYNRYVCCTANFQKKCIFLSIKSTKTIFILTQSCVLKVFPVFITHPTYIPFEVGYLRLDMTTICKNMCPPFQISASNNLNIYPLKLTVLWIGMFGLLFACYISSIWNLFGLQYDWRPSIRSNCFSTWKVFHLKISFKKIFCPNASKEINMRRRKKPLRV